MTEIIKAEAVGIAFAHGDVSEFRMDIESAMRKALEVAQAEGIQDPDILRARMLAARDAAIAA